MRLTLVLTTLFLLSCAPDPVVQRQRQEMGIDTLIQYHRFEEKAHGDTVKMLYKQKTNVWNKM